MKFLFSTVLAVLSASTALAAPTTDLEGFDKAMDSIIVRRDGIANCDECTEHLDVCMKYGHGMTPGILHCADICMAYLCRKWPDCRKCDAKFDKCTDPRLVSVVHRAVK